MKGVSMWWVRREHEGDERKGFRLFRWSTQVVHTYMAQATI
jgi:hypothetical protein